MERIIECVMNVSEGRDLSRLGAIEAAIETVPGARLLHRTADPDHHRAVLTLAGGPTAVTEAAYAAIRKAAQLIDLRLHRGVHPRIGAADVVPLVPLRGVTLDECAELARRLGQRVADRLRIPVYLYEAAALRPDRKSLPEIRNLGFERLREEIAANPFRVPDYGPSRLHSTGGAVVIGARPILIAFNMYLAPPDLGVAREVARLLREKEGGLPGVRSLAFRLEGPGEVQISVNLVDYRSTSLREVFDRAAVEAGRRSCTVVRSQIVGLVPADALGEGDVEHLRLEGFHAGLILEHRLREAFEPARPQNRRRSPYNEM